MNRTKVLITGGGGLLGQYLNIELSKKFEILTVFHLKAGNAKQFNSVQGDISDSKFLEMVFGSFKPDVVVHNAAISNAALADEAGKEKTLRVNVEATKTIAVLARKLNAKLIFNSTDLVYAESKGELLTEDAPLGPASLYAESKILAEEVICTETENFVILRNALMYGFGLNGRRNHFHSVFEKLKAGKGVPLFSDQFRTPLELSDAARLIAEIIEKDVPAGIMNFGGTERVSRFELGEALCQVFGFDNSLIKPVLLKDAPVKYKVADVSMNIDKMQSNGLKPLKIKEALASLKKSFGKEY